MAKIKLTKQEWYDLDLPSSAIEDRPVSVGRWDISYELVFVFNGKYYKTIWSRGATEQQEYDYWEFNKDIGCVEVEQREVTVHQWCEV